VRMTGERRLACVGCFHRQQVVGDGAAHALLTQDAHVHLAQGIR
jgi:hypothetical protein